MRNERGAKYRFGVVIAAAFLAVGVVVGAPVALADPPSPESGVSGTVTDAVSGDPVAGACAYLYRGTTVGAASSTGLAYCTDVDGWYGFAPLPDGEYTVAINDPGHRFAGASAATTVASELPGNPLDFGLQAGPPHIGGTVTAAVSGLPLDDVCVYVYAASDLFGTSLGATCTGSDGRYDIDLPGQEGVDVVPVVSDPEARYNTATGTAVVLSGPATDDLVMTAGSSIAGRVTDTATGAGVPGACLYLFTPGGAPAGYATCVRPDGYYAMADVPAGSYKVGVGDQSGEHISVYSGGVADLDSASTIDIADGLSTPFDAAMNHVNGITVNVVDTDQWVGAVPVEGNCLYLFGLDGSYSGIGSCSNAYGVINLDAPAGSYKAALFDPQGRFVTTWLGGPDIGSASVIDVTGGLVTWPTVELTGLGIVSGRVRDGQGAAIPETSVYLDNLDGSYSGLYGVTDEFGNYAIPSVPEGQYKVGFYPPGMGTPTTIWYSGKTDEASATPITVRSGIETASINPIAPKGE